MPIPYSKIPLNQLLMHQGAYDLIDEVGSKMYPDWDIAEFEKMVLGNEGIKYIKNKQEETEILDSLSLLDDKMPFLKFREEGQHYAYELFLSPSEYWASRGAPFFWEYTARQFTYDNLPMSVEEFREKYIAIVNDFDIPFGIDEYVYIEKIAAGGMSSGVVGGKFVEDALELLCKRLRKYG